MKKGVEIGGMGSRPWVLSLFLLVLLGASFVFSLSVGSLFLMPGEVLRSFFADPEDLMGVAVREIRLPRSVLALMVGGGLGLAGAVLQGYTRNPLADSGLLGISGGAAFGAVTVLYTGFLAEWSFALPVGGLLGAVGATFLITCMLGSATNVQTLILAGVAVSALAGAMTSLVLNFSPNPYAGMEIVYWLLGSVADRSWDHVGLALPFMVLGGVLMLSCHRPLQALSLGDETAATLGFSSNGLRWRVILGSALLVGPATAVAGAIGFVGLVVPHLLRPLVRHDPGKLLAASAMGGSILLLWADIAVRLLPVERELKLGVLTALIGAPFFFYLILKMRRNYP